MNALRWWLFKRLSALGWWICPEPHKTRLLSASWKTSRFRKKPVVIEAFQFGADEAPAWWKAAVDAGRVRLMTTCPEALIQTLEGDMWAKHGDWIIRGVKGELYPCKPNIFQETYEPVP